VVPRPAHVQPKVVDLKPEIAPVQTSAKPVAPTSVAKSPPVTPAANAPGSPRDSQPQTETAPAGIAIETQRAKLVKSGDELRQLRELTPEEKSRRRAFRSLMFMAAGIVLLTVLMALLLKLR
jgi:hypothetical protein